MSELSEEQIKYNISLWKYYSLGHVDSIWHQLEHMRRHEAPFFAEEIDAVYDALQKLDEKLRARHCPFPKQRVKRLNAILPQQRNKSRRAK